MKKQLFCLPYTGGNAASFDTLKPYLSNDTELISIEYAGHGIRLSEPFYSSFDEMVKDSADRINMMITSDEIALFGYSMGSIVAYEILKNNYLDVKPAKLFLASHEAPGEIWRSRAYPSLSDNELFDVLTSFGGLKEQDRSMLDSKYFRMMLFDIIRADYSLMSGYRYNEAEKPDTPALLMFSDNDLPRSEAYKWSNYLSGDIEYFEIGENHFFINSMPERVAELINNRL